MDDKRFFSRVGFSYFMMVVLTVAVQFLLSLLVSLIAPQAAGLPVTSWLLAMVPLYLVAIPVCAKMMQALPNMQLYRNEMRPGQWIRTLCICIFVMHLLRRGPDWICPLNWKNCCPREARGLPYFFLLFWHR